MSSVSELDEFEVRLERLWADWYGVTDVSDRAGAEPRSVRRLRSVAESTEIFGHQDELLPPAGPDASGVVSVIGENQGLWRIGYLPNGTDHPDGVICDYRGDGILAILDGGLTRLLYQAAAIEAIFSGPWMSTIGGVVPEEVRAVLGPHLVATELTDDETFSLPAIWDLGEVLVMGFKEIDLFAGARDLTMIASGPLADLGRWSAG